MAEKREKYYFRFYIEVFGVNVHLGFLELEGNCECENGCECGSVIPTDRFIVERYYNAGFWYSKEDAESWTDSDDIYDIIQPNTYNDTVGLQIQYEVIDERTAKNIITINDMCVKAGYILHNIMPKKKEKKKKRK